MALPPVVQITQQRTQTSIATLVGILMIASVVAIVVVGVSRYRSSRVRGIPREQPFVPAQRANVQADAVFVHISDDEDAAALIARALDAIDVRASDGSAVSVQPVIPPGLTVSSPAHSRFVLRGTERTSLLLDDHPILGRWWRVDRIPPQQTPSVVRHLRQVAGVDAAELDRRVSVNRVMLTPGDDVNAGGGRGPDRVLSNDPFLLSSGSWGQSYPDLWGIYRTQVPYAWPLTIGDPATIVAVVDTGIDLQHEDLDGQVWTNQQEVPDNGVDDDGNGFVDDVHGWDFTTCAHWDVTYGCIAPKPRDNDPRDLFGHGTHVAGTVAATTDNALGIAGVGWSVTVMPIQGLNDEGEGSLGDLVASLLYAGANGADVVNMSWAFHGQSQLLTDTLTALSDAGVVLVASAGNDGHDVQFYSPGSHPSAIAVAAWRPTEQRPPWSNFGDRLSLTAPGSMILSLRATGTTMGGDPSRVIGSKYLIASGTSMAAPHVAGVVGLMRSLAPTMSVGMIRAVLEQTASDLLGYGKDWGTGFGLLNAAGTIAQADRYSEETHPELVVSDVSAQWADQETVVLNGTIRNLGNGPAAATAVVARLPGVGGRELDRQSVAELPPGNSVSFQLTGPRSEVAPVMQVAVDVDPTSSDAPIGTIPEFFEQNNRVVPVPLRDTPGWPKRFEEMETGFVQGPVLGDLTGDEFPELVFASQYGPYGTQFHVSVVDRLGNLLPGWPQDVAGAVLSFALVDLTGDGRPEVVAATDVSDPLYLSSVYAWQLSGDLLPGWPFVIGTTRNPTTSLATGDIDGDGSTEVLIGDSGNWLHALRPDGGEVPGWPRNVKVISDLLVRDLNRDGRAEVLFTTVTDLSQAWLTILDGNGAPLPGWPILGHAFHFNAGDIVGTTDEEIVVGTRDGSVHLYEINGEELPGWPQAVPGQHFFVAPLFVDLVGDPTLEVLAFDEEHYTLYAFDAQGWTIAGWPVRLPPTLYTGYSALVMGLSTGNLVGDAHHEIAAVTHDARLFIFDGKGRTLAGTPFGLGDPMFDAYQPSSVTISNFGADPYAEIIIRQGFAVYSQIRVLTIPWVSSTVKPEPLDELTPP